MDPPRPVLGVSARSRAARFCSVAAKRQSAMPVVPVPLFGNSALFMARASVSILLHGAGKTSGGFGRGALFTWGARARNFSDSKRFTCPTCPMPLGAKASSTRGMSSNFPVALMRPWITGPAWAGRVAPCRRPSVELWDHVCKFCATALQGVLINHGRLYSCVPAASLNFCNRRPCGAEA